ncbi:MAG: hypothetical protein AC479_04810 [miscellaneous Crenarchaeota group-6 archaeon AD8-1]|nr:MAG: hypothetical protein AC479_04810 [miscellaneous Crenarchaeota group-6 archaeon AD8-1]
MEALGITKLTTDQMEVLCKVTENSAKNYILSRIPIKKVEKLNIIVEASGESPLIVNVEVDLVLSTKIIEINPETLAKGALKEALKTSDNFLRQLT